MVQKIGSLMRFISVQYSKSKNIVDFYRVTYFTNEVKEKCKNFHLYPNCPVKGKTNY